MDKIILYCRWVLALMLVGSSWAEPAAPVREIPLVMEGYAGMRVQEITTADRMRYGAALPSQHGVRVEYVSPISPVSLAGLRVDDVLLVIEHYPIFKPEDVLMALARFTPGDMINMTVFRAGKREHLTFVMGKRRAVEVVGYLEFAPITVQNPQQAAEHQRAIAALLAMERPDWEDLQKEFRALHACLTPKSTFNELRFAFVMNDTIINILRREHEIEVMVEEGEGRILCYVLRYVYTKNGEALPAHIKALLKTVSEGAAADIETHGGREKHSRDRG
ncbi:MAG: PDZ domain-containing protein [Akkermansia sp.]|nr:PDZ domain-containing protein [Akkermansia sp.]